MNPTSNTRHAALRMFLALTLALILAFPATAQKKKKKRGKKTFTETTSVTVVEVPVTVTRNGAAVDNLTAENFEITAGKKKQAITGFEIVDLKKIDRLETIERPVPIAARRHFLMLFDLAFSDPESVVKARGAARDLIDSLHPTDLAGVALYTSTQGANILLNFTSDRRQLELAIQTLGAPQLIESARDPLGLVFGSARDFSSISDTISAPTSGGGGAGAEVREQFAEAVNEQVLEMASRIAAVERADKVNKISSFTGNLEALADLLASIDGRKHMVYFSEGIPDATLVGRSNAPPGQGGQERSTGSVADTDFGGDTTFGSTQSQSQLESMIERFRRAGCAIQAVDIGGLKGGASEIGARASGEEGMVSMALDTGGDFYRNFNDLGDAMEKMLERTSVTYLLAFQPQSLPVDGAYHRLKVKLVGAPRGTKVSHRKGYYAPKPAGEVSPGERRLSAAEMVMSDEDSGSLELDVFATAYPVAGEKAYVPVIFEVTGKSLLAEPRDKVEVEVYAYATSTETGEVHDFFVHPVGLDLSQPQAKASFEQTGLKYWGHFDLPPGNYTARVMLRDRKDGRYTLKRQAVFVPEFENHGSVLRPPMFPEPPDKWLLARETEERQRQVEFPFMASGQPFIPAVKPVIPAKGSTAFIFQGVNLADGATFDGEVKSAEGTTVQGAVFKMAEPTTDGGVQSASAQLETQGLAPGEYTLIGTTTGATGEPQTSSIRFVVQ